MTKQMWAALFLIVTAGSVPFLVGMAALPSKGYGGEERAALAFVLALPVSIAPLAFVWRRCSRPGLSFWDSLCFICSRLMSGCANITALYLFPVLWIVLTLALVHSVVGLFKGKGYTEQKWTGILRWFWKHGVGGRDPDDEQLAALHDLPQTIE